MEISIDWFKKMIFSKVNVVNGKFLLDGHSLEETSVFVMTSANLMKKSFEIAQKNLPNLLYNSWFDYKYSFVSYLCNLIILFKQTFNIHHKIFVHLNYSNQYVNLHLKLSERELVASHIQVSRPSLATACNKKMKPQMFVGLHLHLIPEKKA